MNEDSFNTSKKEHFGDTVLGGSIGISFVILAICFGVGSCNSMQMLASKHIHTGEGYSLTNAPVSSQQEPSQAEIIEE